MNVQHSEHARYRITIIIAVTIIIFPSFIEVCVEKKIYIYIYICGWAWWLMSVIPAFGEANVGG